MPEKIIRIIIVSEHKSVYLKTTVKPIVEEPE